MNIIVVIPARYGSTRFSAKVLSKDTGKYLIQHTYEQACQATLPNKVIIAADDQRIVSAAAQFGAECILTSPNHQSGTDRIAQAVKNLDVDIVVNVQADEPEIDPAHIDLVAKLLIDNPEYPMSTLAGPFAAPIASPIKSASDISNPNIVKVITDVKNRAIYFSRSVIPYDRQASGVGSIMQYLRHLGIYAYRKDFLLKITSLAQSTLEKIEKLEQLRVIENGFAIIVGRVDHTNDGIDTPEQYAQFVKRYKK